MSTTYVKIMSGENKPDNHHHKAFQIIPVPYGQSIQFEQDPEPHVQIGDLSYMVSGNVYLMNNEGKTISTFTPRKHDPLKCEEPNEDPVPEVVISHTIEGVRNTIGRVQDLTIIGLENGICYTDLNNYWFVNTMTVATDYGAINISNQIVRYGEVIKFSSLVRKLPSFDVLEDIENGAFVVSVETIRNSIQWKGITHFGILADGAIVRYVGDTLSVIFNGQRLFTSKVEPAFRPGPLKAIEELLGKGSYVMSTAEKHTFYFYTTRLMKGFILI